MRDGSHRQGRDIVLVGNSLPKRFFLFLKKGKPHMHVKSVLAAAFMWQGGKVIWR